MRALPPLRPLAAGLQLRHHHPRHVERRLGRLELHHLAPADELERPDAHLVVDRDRDRNCPHRLLRRAAARSGNARDADADVRPGARPDALGHGTGDRFAHRAVLGQIELHLTARAESRAEADAALDSAVLQLEEALGEAVYSVDGRALEVVVGGLLRARQLTVAVAESCTGGLLASRLTDVPGSSDYVERGAVCYSDRSKIEWLGVPQSLIAEHGAVSEPVARAMADGVRSRAGTKVGIGITGIAGPGGGTPQKPVGTVAIAVLVADTDRVRTFQFVGGREMVKFQATQGALNMLRLMLR